MIKFSLPLSRFRYRWISGIPVSNMCILPGWLQPSWNSKPDNCFVGFLLSELKTHHNVIRFQHIFSQSWSSSSVASGAVLVQANDLGKLCEEIESALDENRLDDAWNVHEQHIQMVGFTRKSMLNKLIFNLSKTLDSKWLLKAYSLVMQAFEDQPQKVLEKNALIYLAVGLGNCGLPEPACNIVRKLIEMEEYPPVGAWAAVLAYVSRTSPGAFIAAELVLEIGYLFQDRRVDPRKKSNESLIAMKPNSTALCIALVGCLLLGTTRKAEQLLEIIPRIGVKVDASLLIIMSLIYGQNGRLDELKKLKRHVEEAPNVTCSQLCQYYNCLLLCLLKVGDLESACNMVLEMVRRAKKATNFIGLTTLEFQAAKRSPSEAVCCNKKPYKVDVLPQMKELSPYEVVCRDRKFLKLEAEAKVELQALIAKLPKPTELITNENGLFLPTERTHAELVKVFLRAGRTKDLVAFLSKAEQEDHPVSADSSLLVKVVHSCIALGLLDEAHDLLDEMHFLGIKSGSAVYSSLLIAYCRENRPEVASLLRDARKAGIQLDAACYESIMQLHVHRKDIQGALSLFKEMKEYKIPRNGYDDFKMTTRRCPKEHEGGLMATFLQEMEEEQAVEYGVHDWNNVIHFFCQKRLMQDAERAFKRMKSLGHSPNVQTFHSLVTGYAAVGGKYTEVTVLWAEMKSLCASGRMKFDQELLDSVLYTFVRGGFFSRANEVVGMIENGKIFIDKYKYRTLFLKYHKTLCKGKVPKFQTESQLRKREATLTFKRWVGLC